MNQQTKLAAISLVNGRRIKMVRLQLIFFIFITTVRSFALNDPSEINVVIPDIAPFGYLEKDQIRGLHHDFFERLSKESGLKFNYSIYPYPRLKSMLAKDGPELGVMFDSFCEQHKDDYLILKRLQRLKLNIHLLSGVDPKSKNLRIVRVRGTCLKYIREALKSENGIDVAEFRQGLEMLELGRADGVCALDVLFDHGIKSHASLREKLVRLKSKSVPELETVLCIRKNVSETIKKRLKKALKHVDTQLD